MKQTSTPILDANFPVCLAPMVGLSHVAFRMLVRRYMPEGARTIWPTEMLNSRRVPKEILSENELTLKEDYEDDLVPQILGNEEIPIRESIVKLKDWGAKGIDINMGCPVKKALRHNYGVALMGDMDYAAQVVSMAKNSSTLPVSVKLRAGLQNNMDFLLTFTEKLQNAGADWITLHPRTSEQKRRGTADWEQIKIVKQKLKIPVIGNGDIQIASDVIHMREQTNCDMVMVGRALTARPWLMWQVGELLGFPPPKGFTGTAPRTPYEEGAELGRSLLFLLEQFEKYFAEPLGVRKFKFYIRHCHCWLMFGHQLFTLTSNAHTYPELKKALEEFFSREQSLSQKTDLRI